MESDLGTRLDWISIAHWNTDNPLVHLVARGVANDGSDLVISRDYISHGQRSRRQTWSRPSSAPGASMKSAPLSRGRWKQSAGRDSTRQSGWRPMTSASSTRGRTIRARAIRRRAVSPPADCTASSPIIGRLVATGLHDELTGQAYAVIGGDAGRAYHRRLRGIDAFADAPPAGAIVEVHRFGGPSDPRPTLVLVNRSDIDLDRQVTAPGATWLDYRLVERQRMPLAMSGVGQEVRDAMEARAKHLAADVLARRQEPSIVPQRDLRATLQRRELDAAGAGLSAETPTRRAVGGRDRRRYLPPPAASR
jgi:Protein of unknown function (DUF3363)